MKEEKQREGSEKEVNELLALCAAAAEMWDGEFDAVKEINQLRQQRDDQIWQSKS